MESKPAPARGAWPDLTADLEFFAGGPPVDRPARVAITSYEFVGVVRNGGIGTACTELALALAREGHEVDLLFTGWGEDPSEEGFGRWRSHYEEQGVKLDRLDFDAVAHCDRVLYNASHSLALYRRLRERNAERPYDAIHFVESLGHGYYSLLAKRQGLAFAEATTVVCAHSPRRWLAEAHAAPFDNPIELGDEFLERRCLELADVAVAPSAHMLDWLKRRGTRLPRRSYVQQYVSSFDLRTGAEPLAEPSANGRPPAADAGKGEVEELVFFGRLEPRKGVLTFCDALDELAEEGPGRLRRITFLGKEAVPVSHLLERAQDWPWEATVISDLDREDALAYLRGPGRMAVMASAIDNSPNTVYEAIGLGIPFFASRGGGIGELVHPDDRERVTFDPRDPERREIDPGDPAATRPVHSGRALAAGLRSALSAPREPVRFAVDPAVNREAHLAWHRAARAPEPSLPDAPNSLPEPIAIEAAASHGEGEGDERLLLVDPEVRPLPELAATLSAAAASCSEAPFLTPFGSFEAQSDDGPVKRIFLPTGGPAVTGLFGNCAGAGAVLARRDALRRIGALDSGDGAPASVAELLARAVIAGEGVDVVPRGPLHAASRCRARAAR